MKSWFLESILLGVLAQRLEDLEHLPIGAQGDAGEEEADIFRQGAQEILEGPAHEDGADLAVAVEAVALLLDGIDALIQPQFLQVLEGGCPLRLGAARADVELVAIHDLGPAASADLTAGFVQDEIHPLLFQGVGSRKPRAPRPDDDDLVCSHSLLLLVDMTVVIYTW